MRDSSDTPIGLASNKNSVQGSRPVTPAAPSGLLIPKDFPPLIAPPKQAFSPESQSLAKKSKPTQPLPVKPAVPVLAQQRCQDQERSSIPITPQDANTAANGQEEIAKVAVRPTRIKESRGKESSDSIQMEEKASVEKGGRDTDSTKFIPDNHIIGSIGETEGTLGKRQRPRKLDIAAATEVKAEAIALSNLLPESSKPSTPRTVVRGILDGIASQPGTPLTSISQSSASSATRQPRTLRVVQTPQLESLPKAASSHSPSSVPASSITSAKQHSRQPSVASVKLPGTPVNDTLSDNASLTSASASRPSSPHGNKAGSGPVRQKTKSQIKKERQIRAKQIGDLRLSEESPVSPVPEEVVQGPIIGRKKKAKKPVTSTLVPSTEKTDFEPKQGMDKVEYNAGSAPPDEVDKTSKSVTKQDTPTSSAPSEVRSKRVPKSAESYHENTQRGIFTPATVLADLQRAGIISARTVELFLSVPGVHHRFDSSLAAPRGTEDMPPLSEDQRRTLDQGNAVSVEIGERKWAVVLPNRSVLRHLSYDEAQRYLSLRENLISSGAHVFNSSDPPSRAPKTGSDQAPRMAHYPSMTGSQICLPDQWDFSKAFTSDAFEPDASCHNGSAQLLASGSMHEAFVERLAMMTVDEVEHALRSSEELLMACRRDTEALEKRLNPIVKRNRKALRE